VSGTTVANTPAKPEEEILKLQAVKVEPNAYEPGINRDDRGESDSGSCQVRERSAGQRPDICATRQRCDTHGN